MTEAKKETPLSRLRVKVDRVIRMYRVYIKLPPEDDEFGYVTYNDFSEARDAVVEEALRDLKCGKGFAPTWCKELLRMYE